MHYCAALKSVLERADELAALVSGSKAGAAMQHVMLGGPRQASARRLRMVGLDRVSAWTAQPGWAPIICIVSIRIRPPSTRVPDIDTRGRQNGIPNAPKPATGEGKSDLEGWKN